MNNYAQYFWLNIIFLSDKTPVNTEENNNRVL